MSRTIKDMPYYVRMAEYNKVKLTSREFAILRRRWSVGPTAVYKIYREEMDAILEKIEVGEHWKWHWYGSSPREFRQALTRARRAKVRDLMIQERYDDIPKWRRDAAWLYW